MDFKTFRSKSLFHICGLFSFLLFPLYLRTRKNINIKTIDATLDELINSKKSISRFGDGEVKWIFKDCNDSFQDNSNELSLALIRTIKNNNPNLMIGLSDSLKTIDNLDSSGKKYAINFWSRYYFQFRKYLSEEKQYYNAEISRPYMDYDKENIEVYIKYFNKIKKLWNNKDVLIVEGEKSYLGLGNDLFDGARSISRIECPSENAFNKYDLIISTIKNHIKRNHYDIVLIALGPTATILSSDLCDYGIQSVDIGHIDLEYEWFRMGATTKIDLNNRYVNEVTGGNHVSEINDMEFSKEIIDKIK